MVITEHYIRDNANREAAVQSLGKGYPIAKFFWNRQHRDGGEIHIVYSNAVIEVYNELTGRLITKLPARPAQLTRYVQMGLTNELNDRTRKMRNWLVPQAVINLARRNQRNGLNYS